MPKGTCASCLDFDVNKIVKSKESLKPEWLQRNDYVRDFIEKQNMTLRNPPYSNVEMRLQLGSKYAGKKILYWAATEKTSKSPLILDAKKAYHNFENNGIVKVSSSGSAVLKFACPQLYKTAPKNQTNSVTFFRHLHFVIEKDEKWDNQIYTKIVICKYNLKKFLQEKENKLTILINALPSEYFAKDHIPNSYNLYHKEVAKMSTSDLENWFHQVVQIHYPKLYTYVRNKKLDIYELPIVVYCAHDKCNAAELTIKELMKKGFVNLNEYDGGMKDYRNKFPQDN